MTVQCTETKKVAIREDYFSLIPNEVLELILWHTFDANYRSCYLDSIDPLFWTKPKDFIAVALICRRFLEISTFMWAHYSLYRATSPCEGLTFHIKNRMELLITLLNSNKYLSFPFELPPMYFLISEEAFVLTITSCTNNHPSSPIQIEEEGRKLVLRHIKEWKTVRRKDKNFFAIILRRELLFVL